uniref:PH_TFIIH domain-containing protein n=1 Tax=Caenorhabditis tropicalis TaxID=1561998 RepID=A0A1I7U2A6_9PELO
MKLLNVSKIDGVFTIKILTERKKKLKFRINAKNGGLWLAKLQDLVPESRDSTSLRHETHAEIRDGDLNKDLKEWEGTLPTSNCTGSREGYKPPGSDPSGSEPKDNKEQQEKVVEKGGDKSGDKKKESEKKIKSVESKTKLKKTQSNTSKTRKRKGVKEAPPPKQEPDSVEELKKTQELEKSVKAAPPKPVTPGLTPTMTPTPVVEEKPKTKTDSDENEAPEKKS